MISRRILEQSWQPSSSTGTLRLGGMQPAEMYANLPKTYYVSRILHSRRQLLPAEDVVVLFCNHDDVTGEPLEWLRQGIIRFRGKVMPLAYSPSYRTNWCCFTILTEEMP